MLYRVTEADLRLFPTLIRYDSVYANLFKCSKRRVGDYPRLKEWLREMYNLHVGDGKGMQVWNHTITAKFTISTAIPLAWNQILYRRLPARCGNS